MSRFLNAWSISTRLYVLLGLFGCGVAGLGVQSLRLEWQVLRAGHLAQVTALSEAAAGILVRNHALAVSGAMPEAAARAAALAEIGAMPFERDNYLFVLNGQNVMIQHDDPAQIGWDRSNFADVNGFKYTADVMPRARRDGFAFVTYDFLRPGQHTPVQKLAGYRYYPPWDWTIGTGIYLDDLHVVFWSSARQLAACIAGAMAGLWGLAQLIIRSIAHPLMDLRESMAVLVRGDVTAEVPHGNLAGEVGAMARAVIGFKTAAQQKAKWSVRPRPRRDQRGDHRHGPGDAAKRRHGGGGDRRQPRTGRRDQRAWPTDRALPNRRRRIALRPGVNRATFFGSSVGKAPA